MPQLEFADFVPQLIWLAIAFTFLFVVMTRIALPRIAGVIEERRDKIADDLDRAAEFKKEAEEALAMYEQALAEARTRALAIASEHRDEVKSETERLRAETDAKIADMTRDAERRIKQAKDAALANIPNVATETAVALVKKLLGQQIDTSSASTAVNSELSRSQS